VKNVALAVQMYLADNNDTLPPMETSPQVLDWFAANAPNWPRGGACYEAPTLANPYLRWPVILDEYVKNRAVWQCPSARHDNVAGNVNSSRDWFAAFSANKAKVIVQGWATTWGFWTDTPPGGTRGNSSPSSPAGRAPATTTRWGCTWWGRPRTT
jgi:hypothetical protein